VFTTVQEVADYIYELLNEQAGALGLGYIGYADERLNPAYPVAIVSPGALQRELETTRQFHLTITCDIYVLHAKLSEGHRDRNRSDMKLATDITNLLLKTENFVLGYGPNGKGNVIHGWVEEEEPGDMVGVRGGAVVSTRLGYSCETRQLFRT
jgi:hypothetical protein